MENLTVLNPFVVGRYVSDKYFCDREKETEFLIKQIENGRNIALISPRRMGKTGLIRHCFHRSCLSDNYYTFFVENNILNCINKESKYVTKISFSNGIAESIFIYYDDTYGDYYTLDTENKDTTYWNFLMKYNSYRFKQ